MYHFGKLGTVDQKRSEKLPFRAEQVKEITLSETHAFILTTEGRVMAMGPTTHGVLPSKHHEKQFKYLNLGLDTDDQVV